MHNKIIVSTFIILIIICFNTIFANDNNENIYSSEVWINNINEKSIKIKVKDIKISKEPIKINHSYEAFAIITMEVENNGTYDIELSNIDVYPYQNNKATQYFVTTSKENVNGFIGNLKPNNKTYTKIGITLHNTKDPIKLVLSNIEDIKNEKVIQNINIK